MPRYIVAEVWTNDGTPESGVEVFSTFDEYEAEVYAKDARKTRGGLGVEFAVIRLYRP